MERKRNIPVICNSSRSEQDGNGVITKSVHLNPKFFPAPLHAPRMNLPNLGPLPNFHFNPQLPCRGPFMPRDFTNQNPGRFPRPYNQQFTHNSYPPFRFHPSPRFDQLPPRPFPIAQPRFPAEYRLHQPFQNPQGFNQNNGYRQFSGPLSIENTDFRFPLRFQPPLGGKLKETGHVPELSYYGSTLNEHISMPSETQNKYSSQSRLPQPSLSQNVLESHIQNLGFRTQSLNPRKTSGSPRTPRSRSRSYRSLRSRSNSSRSFRNRSRSSRSFRSRSVSAETSSSVANRQASASHSSSPKHSSIDESDMYSSENDYHSDADYDLSKPLCSLIDNVSNARELLKNALGCISRSKLQGMIPSELKQLAKKQLLGLCETVLDETDNEKLMKIMEGTVKSTDESTSDETIFVSNSSDQDSAENPLKELLKKKKSRKKSRRRKKRKVLYENATETEKEASSEYEDIKRPVIGKNESKQILTAEKTQQSLLELIQIEYKTKAINVMLQNLGVASDISSIVNKALISGLQGLANHETQSSSRTPEKALPMTSRNIFDCNSEESRFSKIPEIEETTAKSSQAISNFSDIGAGCSVPSILLMSNAPVITEQVRCQDSVVEVEHEEKGSHNLKEMDCDITDILELGVCASDELNLPDDDL